MKTPFKSALLIVLLPLGLLINANALASDNSDRHFKIERGVSDRHFSGHHYRPDDSHQYRNYPRHSRSHSYGYYRYPQRYRNHQPYRSRNYCRSPRYYD